MDIKALQKIDLYDKHFDAIEPEAHTVISIKYAIKVFEETRDEMMSRYMTKSAKYIQDKIDDLQKLIS